MPSHGQNFQHLSGYVIDHIVALKRGGPDAPDNMQWQSIEEAKTKDRIEYGSLIQQSVRP